MRSVPLKAGFLALLLLGSAFVGLAEMPELIPRQVLFGDPDITSPAVSPDGATLAYCANYRGVLNVWGRSADRQDDRLLTRFGKGGGIGGFTWSPDGRHVLFASCNGGDENWHLMQVEVGAKPGTRRKDLTPFRGVQARFLKSSPLRTDAILITLNRDRRDLFEPYLLQLPGGRLTRAAVNPGNAVGWVADAHLRVLGMKTLEPEGGTAIWVRSDVDEPWRKVFRAGPEEDALPLGFVGRGRELLLLHDVGAERRRLVRLPLDGGGEQEVCRPETEEIVDVLLHQETGEPLAVCLEGPKRRWVALSSSVERDFRALEQEGEGTIRIISRDLADRFWVVSLQADTGPIRFCLRDRYAEKTVRLFVNRPRLERYERARMTPVTVRARDGLELPCYLTLPVGVEPRRLPLVALVHGGPWDRDSWGWQPDVQWLANRGYAVLQVNFRGSKGFGRRFSNAGDRQWASGIPADIVDAVGWAVQTGLADPARLGVMGSSFGGYAVLALAAFHPGTFRCGIDTQGPSDILEWFGGIPAYWKPLKSMLERRVGDPARDASFLRSISPYFSAGKIDMPLLVAQGANDPRVSAASARRMVAALRNSGKTVTYLEFPDEGHGFSHYPNALAFAAQAEEFLARHLGGRWEPPGLEETRILRRVTVKFAPRPTLRP